MVKLQSDKELNKHLSIDDPAAFFSTMNWNDGDGDADNDAARSILPIVVMAVHVNKWPNEDIDVDGADGKKQPKT